MTELRITLLGSGYMGCIYAECTTKHNSRAKLMAVSGGSHAPGLAAVAIVEVAREPARSVQTVETNKI
jgi:hypothetical protein